MASSNSAFWRSNKARVAFALVAAILDVLHQRRADGLIYFGIGAREIGIETRQHARNFCTSASVVAPAVAPWFGRFDF